MSYVSLKPPYNVKITWTDRDDPQKISITRHANSNKTLGEEHFDVIPVPEGMGSRLSVQILGKAKYVDVSNLGPDQIASFGDLGNIYSGVRVGNPNLVSVPNVLPTTFTTIADMLSGSTNFDDRNIEEWDTANITSAERAFKDCRVLRRNLTCWQVDKITGEPTEVFAESGIPVRRKPRWGQSAADRAGRTGLPCTALNLSVIGSSTILTNEFSAYNSESQADIEDGELVWELVAPEDVPVDSVNVDDKTIVVKAAAEAVVRMKVRYNDGKYSGETYRDVTVVDSIRIDAPPTINSLGCGAMIFITANVSGDLTGIDLLWEQISGTPVEIDNATSLTMGFVRPSTGLSGGGEEYVFRLSIGKGSDVERYLDVRVSAAPTTYITSINPTQTKRKSSANRYIKSNVTIIPNGRDGGGGLLLITSSPSGEWLGADVYLKDESGWTLTFTVTQKGFSRNPVTEDGIYMVIDKFSRGIGNYATTDIVELSNDRVFQVGYEFGVNYSDIGTKQKYPSRVLHTTDMIPSLINGPLSSAIDYKLFRQNFSRLIQLVDDSYVGIKGLESIEMLQKSAIRTHSAIVDQDPTSDILSSTLTGIVSSASKRKLTRFDINYVAG